MMCYSFDASLHAWLVSFVCSIYMLAHPALYGFWIPIFILTFTQIQVAESIIWAGPDRNAYMTRMIGYLLWLQPLVSSYIGYLDTRSVTLFYMAIFFGIMMIFYHFSSGSDTFESIPGATGSLRWDRFDSDGKLIPLLGNRGFELAYLTGMIMPFMYMESNAKYVPCIVGIPTLLWNRYFSPEEFGSKWCYSAVSMSIISVGWPYFFQ